MVKIALSICFCLIAAICGAQNCSILEEGRYEMFYDPEDVKVSAFEIRDDKYYSEDDNYNKGYEIDKLDACSFQIIDLETQDQATLSEFQKVVSKQKYYFEITKVEGKTFYFICRVDLHINCGTGKFIRKS